MAAPKGNKYAEGNNGGRPAMYENPNDLEVKINEYFESIKPIIVFKRKLQEDDYIKQHKQVWDDGKPIGYQITEREGIPATVNGLTLFLGFSDKQSLYDYQKKDEFTCLIKKARTRVEQEYEKNLTIGSPAGAIFALKNMGWVDRKEVENVNEKTKFVFVNKSNKK